MEILSRKGFPGRGCASSLRTRTRALGPRPGVSHTARLGFLFLALICRPPRHTKTFAATPVSVTAGSSPQIQQQLETMTTELAAVRGLAEQIAVSQKKMSQDIAALETTNLSQKTWWLYQSSAFDAPPQKSVKKIAPSPAKSSPGPAPVPTTRAQTP